MSKEQNFIELIDKNDTNAMELYKLTLLEQCIVDMIGSVTLQLESATRKLGMPKHKTNQLLNNYIGASKKLCNHQLSVIGTDKVAEDFGALADLTQSIMKESIFMIPGQKEQLINLLESYNKIKIKDVDTFERLEKLLPIVTNMDDEEFLKLESTSKILNK